MTYDQYNDSNFYFQDGNGKKEVNDNLNSKPVENTSSKKSISLRNPKVKPKASESATSNDANNGSVNTTASRKDSVNGKNIPLILILDISVQSISYNHPTYFKTFLLLKWYDETRPK